MTELLVFLVMLSALVVSHEVGHFIAAKKTGMRVDEFGIGFPPRLFSFRHGETLYSINLIPFGGFVRIHGETAGEGKNQDDPDSERRFDSRPRWAQSVVVLAGAFFNFLLAWVLISAAGNIGSLAVVTDENEKYAHDIRAMVVSTSEHMPASEAGIMPKDVIAAIVVEGEEVPINRAQEVGPALTALTRGEQKPVTFLLKRNDSLKEVVVTPVKKEGRLVVGVELIDVGFVRYPLLQALWFGAQNTFQYVNATIFAFLDLLQRLFSAGFDGVNGEQVLGPVGLYRFVVDANREGVSSVLILTAVISINLGVINLIPFPALDGGRFFFILIEAVLRRPLSARLVNGFNYVGFSLLIFLMLWITYRDIVNII